VLLLRGRAEVTDVTGVAPEYAQAARRYLGEEAATAFLWPGHTLLRDTGTSPLGWTLTTMSTRSPASGSYRIRSVPSKHRRHPLCDGRLRPLFSEIPSAPPHRSEPFGPTQTRATIPRLCGWVGGSSV
jgi:hypothetical protein